MSDFLEEKVFRKVNRDWSQERLLGESGWFPLADVMKLIDPKGTGRYRKILGEKDKLARISDEAVKSMGLKQFGNRIWTNMPVFSQWYRQHRVYWVKRIPKNWDLHVFLEQKSGIFTLNRVLQLLPREWPIKYPAMTSMIHKEPNPKDKMGADRLDGVYVVFMPRFGEWLKKQML